MKRYLIVISLIIGLGSTLSADELYKIKLTNAAEAELLREINATPVTVLTDGYLILADAAGSAVIESSNMDFQHIASGLNSKDLAIDHRHDRLNLRRHTLLYEQDDLRLFRVDLSDQAASADLIPISPGKAPIEFRQSTHLNTAATLGFADLDSLVGLVSQDSVVSYMTRLEAFNGRYTGTDSNWAASQWIFDKFTEFDYDSVVFDSFIGRGSGGDVAARNVVAYKIGSRYPSRHIVIGGHMDAVNGSPGADDDGSGTAGVMEIARVLRYVETDITLIFIAFDSEESGLIGSRHYANNAYARGDDITFMLNMDMIGYLPNDTLGKIFHGPETAYAELWVALADNLVGITGLLTGASGSSDHAPFINNGYNAIFVHESIFSTVYHSPADRNNQINFDYQTRMIKASLATVYAVSQSIPDIHITAINDVGDGQSLQIEWNPLDTNVIEFYRLYYDTEPPSQVDSVNVSSDSTLYTVNGLTEGQSYIFWIAAFDDSGQVSLVINQKEGTPRSIPRAPSGLVAVPVRNAVRLDWSADGRELDFDHYALMRDDAILPGEIADSTFLDTDPALGSDFHTYFVLAVDGDGNVSDTVGVTPAIMKAATLQPGRILAINRSAPNSFRTWVDWTLTQEFLAEALGPYSADLAVDTSYLLVGLTDLIDYETIVVAGESARRDDILVPGPSKLLEDISKFLSLGGKAVVFGRWGDIHEISETDNVDTLNYPVGTEGFAYTDYFHIAARVQPLSLIDFSTRVIISDFVGARSQVSGYPHLIWDSAATMRHSDPPLINNTSGIPCPSFIYLQGGPTEVVYTYDSDFDSVLTEGRTVGWRYRGNDYGYVFFEFPLSFMERPPAVAALQQALADLDYPTSVGSSDQPILPDDFALAQNFPNPFNASTQIRFFLPAKAEISLELFNILGQKVITLRQGIVAAGAHTISWDGRNSSGSEASSGIYLYRLTVDGHHQSRKMLLLK